MSPATKGVEDPRLLKGEGQFVADVQRPGMLHLAFFRSPYAHARIQRLAVEAARAYPGVAAVITAEDLAHTNPIQLSDKLQPDFQRGLNVELHDPVVRLLGSERVRYVGEPLASVAAESRAIAEDALELIELEAEPLSVITGEAALAAPELYPGQVPGNVMVSLGFERGQPPEDGHVAHTVRARYVTARQGASPIETRGLMAEPGADGRITIWASTQIPHRVKDTTAAVLHWDPARIRVITPDVGGGFGMKDSITAEGIVAAFLAGKLGRPVRWIADRTEDLTAAVQGRDQVHDVELAVDAGGRILSFADDFLVDLGAYSARAVGTTANSALHAFGTYHLPHMRIRGRGFVSNKPPSSQYRGAGRPEVCFALERALDEAARALGIDPAELRWRNMIQPAEMPYPQQVPQRDGVPIHYDASDYPAVLAEALALAEGCESPPLRPGERLGQGCSTYVEASGRGPFEGARVLVEPDGRVRLFAGSAGSGQGHSTTLPKVCAAALGVRPEQVILTEGDTDLIPEGIGTFASRTAVNAGNAVHQASLQLREQALATAADRLRCPPTDLRWEGGSAHAPDGRSVSLAELAGLEALAYFRPNTVAWTMGAHVAQVAVDVETGGVRVLHYVSVHEGGPSLDERIVEGQMHGGVVQGISGALLEEVDFGDEGQPQAITMADYMIAGAVEAPDVALGHVFSPGDNPLGVKGVGESGCVGAAAALANAISDALSGAPLRATPLKPERVWRAAG
ncbi:MAG TPA: xanthine dehydrogenase family protein molybdopterin-binding subunit [Chloroflexota bacterium]|nr:xanthine dehydrogenase family protein molybdopterin-binding subunit [Chloroflexota bacterium]